MHYFGILLLFVVISAAAEGYAASGYEDQEIIAAKDEETKTRDGHRIMIGGPDAHVVPKNSQPWVVRVIGGCTGTLISSNHVLTAAHCHCNLGVVLGDHSISDQDDGGETFDGECIRHPKWTKDPNAIKYDAAIIILKKHVDFNSPFGTKTIQPANLPKENETCQQFGKQMDASGWGYNMYAEKKPDKLWTVRQECLAPIDCADKKIDTDGASWFEEDTMICVGDKENPDNSACNGDSGGPLSHTRNGITTVYGITQGPGSLPNCAATGIFTKVSAPEIMNWITEKTGVLPSGYQFQPKYRQCGSIDDKDLLEHECREIATSMGKHISFAGTQRKYNYPMGCYLLKGRQVWFNRDPIGNLQKDSTSICKIYE